MNRIVTASTLIAAAAFATTASADIIDARFVSKGKGRDVRITYGSTTKNVFAGQLNFRLSNGSGAASALNGDWVTFCTDLAQGTNSTNKSFEVVPLAQVPNGGPMGGMKAAAIVDLYNYANGQQLGSTANQDFAAAFQIAVWEIVRDYDFTQGASSLSLASGDFKATGKNGATLSSAIAGHVGSLFAAVGHSSGSASLLGLRNGSSQDQVLPVPAPGPAVLAAAAGLMALPRRRRAA